MQASTARYLSSDISFILVVSLPLRSMTGRLVRESNSLFPALNPGKKTIPWFRDLGLEEAAP